MKLAPEHEDFGVVVAGHGSRDPDSTREFEALVALLCERAPGRVVTHGYLEFATPTIDAAIQANIARGARQIVVVPSVLLGARHAKNDMPAEILALARSRPDLGFHFGAPLDIHPKLLRLVQQRIVEAEARSARTVRRDDTCLVLVGRGTTDPDANGEIAKLARMVEEGMGFGGVQVCFSGTARPLVTDGLRAAARLGYARVLVLPFFLFDGVLVKRIYAAADDLASREPELEVLKAGYLGAHPDVADVMLERAREAIEGRAAMNCTLCKYRVQIVGFEEQVGEPQRAHHGAVRGLLGRPGPGEAARQAPAPAPMAQGAPAGAGGFVAGGDPTRASGSDAVGADQTRSSRSGFLGDDRTCTLNSDLPERFEPYVPHPIEAESFDIIRAGRDWSTFPADQLMLLQRLVHTSGDFGAVDDLFISGGAIDAGIRALLRCKRIVTDVTMVETGLKRALLAQLGIRTWCGVHDRETYLIAETHGLTRSAAGVRRAWEKFGNDVVIAIGDAPTAIAETTRLIRDHGWRPQLVVGLPVGFVGTRESKLDLRQCLQVPRITNSGTRGGSPWAASVMNALMIDALNRLAAHAQADPAGL